MFSELLKLELYRSKLTQKEVAEKLETSPSLFSQQIKRDNFRETDMRIIADALGYDLEINLIPRNPVDKH